MHPQNKGHRNKIRYHKGVRRLHEKLAGHECYVDFWALRRGKSPLCTDWECNTERGRGKRFAQLADRPQSCSCDGCGNQRNAWGSKELTRQELWSRERVPIHKTDPSQFHSAVPADDIEVE